VLKAHSADKALTRMSNQLFKHHLRVPYAHIDKMGVVYYAHYLEYFEMARATLLREVGMPYTIMENRGIFLPVVSAHCDYKKPARYDDLLVVISQCTALRGPRLHIEYILQKIEDGTGQKVDGEGEKLATGYTEHVCLSAEGKIMRPTEELKRLTENVDT